VPDVVRGAPPLQLDGCLHVQAGVVVRRDLLEVRLTGTTDDADGAGAERVSDVDEGVRVGALVLNGDVQCVGVGGLDGSEQHEDGDERDENHGGWAFGWGRDYLRRSFR
jgi:hypothetical protein